MNKMTPTHTPLILRRSEARVFRAPATASILNDDEAERRKRRTLFEAESDASSISTSAERDALTNCIQICNDNKLNKENAWQISVIDTLSKLLDKHHKILNNFKVAGSSLEASTKIYGLRVDSIHTDVCRLSAELNKKKFTDNKDQNDEDNQNDLNQTKTNDGEQEHQTKDKEKPKRKKRARKQLSTVVKSKETINGKLDTHPFTDPIFAKLNSITCSINSSSRLLTNILSTKSSKILINMDIPFWDSEPSENVSFADEINYGNYENLPTVESDIIHPINLNNLNLRTIHTGYIISDTPAEDDSNDVIRENDFPPFYNGDPNESQLAVAFDINAEVKDITMDDNSPMIDVDMNDLDDLNADEHIAITHCRGLHRQPIILEDMRPIDSTNLEYSYRPIDKISQFWAGPSHWKFKRSTLRGSNINKENDKNQQISSQKSKLMRCKGRKPKDKLVTLKNNDLELSDLFVKVTASTKKKLKSANIQKKWDAKRLRLPTDLQLDSNMFDVFKYANSMKSLRRSMVMVDDDDTDANDDCLSEIHSGYNYDNPIDKEYCPNIEMNDGVIDPDRDLNDIQTCDNNEIPPTQNHIEIATDYAGAPDKIMRIFIPFAKRAKVIDMKYLKKACLHLLTNQVIQNKRKDNQLDNEKLVEENLNNDDSNTVHLLKNLKYKDGYTSFQNVYSELPKILPQKMNEAVTPSIAFYSILHIANEKNLRLIPQDDLKDFKILEIEN